MEDGKILKYINGSASLEEIKEVENWIGASEEHANRFNMFKAQYIASTFDETTKDTDVDKALEQFKDNIGQPSITKYRRLAPIFKYAAMIVVLFGLGYLFTTDFFDSETLPVVTESAITLELENGNVQVIKEDGSTQVIDAKGNTIGKQKGNTLVYDNSEPSEKLIYNTLTVPYGKRFDIILSDSTHVLLNAGTSIKYPVKFIKGKDRLVFLNGEAYFDVAKDAEHPFIVNANGFSTKVLGTQFNISAYTEDETTNTVLVEGSVTVYEGSGHDSKDTKLLTPGNMATYQKNSKEILVEPADISLYTAWTNGTIVFRHLPFKSIVKKLERHYNVTITNNNTALENELFTASFDVHTIEQVLETFKNHYNIDYTINNNMITIY